MTPSATVWDTRNGVAQNVFQAPPRDDLEAAKVVTFARTSLHARTLGLIHDENEYGTNGARVVTNVAKDEGLQVIDDESYPGDGTDFTAQVGRLRAAKPDVVVLWGGTQTPALVTRAVRTLGVTAPLIGSSGILSEGYLHVAAATSEGVYSVTSLNFTHPDERQRRFLASYHDAFHVRPNAFAAFGWDAANVIVAGLRAGGPSSALAATMQSMPPVAGVDGTYRFSPSDHNGLTASSLHIAVAKNEVWFTQ
jgi:branched-chain amino acid transport system substrate-binding protein